MSVLVGKAQRFSSVGSPKQTSDLRSERAQEAITHSPLPPAAYQNLRSGPQVSIEYEANEAVPIEGSEKLLRSLSPFLIQVEPPMIYANDPALFDGPSKRGMVEAYGKARRYGYGNARAALRGAGFSGFDFQGASVEQVISTTSPNDPTATAFEGGAVPNKLGKPAIADLYVALDIAQQLAAAINTPPLVLLINPSTLQMAYNKIQTFQDRTRFGYVFQAWGEEQPKLSITAKCGAFYSGGRGVQFASKRDSAAWQNLMGAFQFYQNNGYIYDTVGKSNAHHQVGSLSIHYDGWVYYGHMESFAFTYDESHQLGGIEFTMEFVVSLMVDTSKATLNVLPMRSPLPNANDPRYYTQGRGGREGQLSIGLDGDVNDLLFKPGRKPEVWARDSGRVGDTGFGSVQTHKKAGSAVLTRNQGGFTTPTAREAASIDLAADPKPFRR